MVLEISAQICIEKRGEKGFRTGIRPDKSKKKHVEEGKKERKKGSSRMPERTHRCCMYVQPTRRRHGVRMLPFCYYIY